MDALSACQVARGFYDQATKTCFDKFMKDQVEDYMAFINQPDVDPDIPFDCSEKKEDKDVVSSEELKEIEHFEKPQEATQEMEEVTRSAVGALFENGQLTWEELGNAEADINKILHSMVRYQKTKVPGHFEGVDFVCSNLVECPSASADLINRFASLLGYTVYWHPGVRGIKDIKPSEPFTHEIGVAIGYIKG